MPHYYDTKQDSEFTPQKIKAVLRKRQFEFTTAGGVFSPKKVDKGSTLLINTAEVDEGDVVLDLGCGYGPVGIAIAKTVMKTKVTMTDVNQRAVKLARMNIKNNKLENATVIQGNGFEKIKSTFNVILFNPPQSAGRKLCNDLIEESKQFLKKGGSLQVVARHNKGGKLFEEFMEEIFGNVETLEKSGGFRIYKSILQ